MIVPMKKIAVILQSKDASFGINELRKQGVVHVEHQQPPRSKDLIFFREELALFNQAAEILLEEGAVLGKTHVSDGPPGPDLKTAARHVVDLWKRRDQLEEFARALSEKIIDWQDWGDFDPSVVDKLSSRGVQIKFYQIPLKDFKRIPASCIVKKIAVRSGSVFCLLISLGKVECPFKEIELPESGLNEMRLRLRHDEEYIKELTGRLRGYLSCRQGILSEAQKLRKSIELCEALSGMGVENDFVYLVGYIPAEFEPAALELAEKEKWGVYITEPKEDDNVPTLIRSPRWVSIIKPVFQLLEIVPGYRELDISPVFLLFFGIFFGMLIGDAGYGVVYFLLTLWAHKKFGKKIKKHAAFFLFYILSFCAIIWGLLTGVFFGQAWLFALGMKPLVPALNDTKIIQAFCFFLGALHLSIAHSWRAVLKLPSLAALADIGWICVLWTAYFLAKTLILSDAFPAFGGWLLIAGASLVILFTKPQRNIFKAVGSGLGTLALSLMNNFTDVVSYVRLFAVGLATVAIADTFNSMAAGVGTSSLFTLILSVIIIFAGHALNLILGPMSVLVHGVRLNILEFSSHANVSWSGTEYKPLKE